MITCATCRLAVCLLTVVAVQAAADDTRTLKPVSAFSRVTDQRARSVALFTEAAKVIRSPRCLNCHPATREVTQGDDLHAHVPFVDAGRFGVGAPGLPCRACHEATNTLTLSESIASIPGSPAWGIAPASMAWQGKSMREICLQIQDPARNGGRTLAKLREHMAMDPVVSWAWHPGEGRAPAPGSQVQFAALIGAWIDTGAQCPQS
jgi:hypothetical protein